MREEGAAQHDANGASVIMVCARCALCGTLCCACVCVACASVRVRACMFASVFVFCASCVHLCVDLDSRSSPSSAPVPLSHSLTTFLDP